MARAKSSIASSSVQSTATIGCEAIMSNWQSDIQEAMHAFKQVSALAGTPIDEGQCRIEFLPAPHRPPSSLTKGQMAIYGFWGDGEWLKIGMAGAKSQARFTSQHYIPGSAPSTLAASLVADTRMLSVDGFHGEKPGEWMKNHCHRVNITFPASYGRPLLSH